MTPAISDRYEGERRRLWCEPRAVDLVDLVERPAERYPDVPALRLCHHGSEDETITWRALWNGAFGVRAQLEALGLADRDRVLLIVPTSSLFFASFFGVLLAGGIPVPIAPPASRHAARLDAYVEMIRHVLVDSGARICVLPASTPPGLESRLQTTAPHIRLLTPDSLHAVAASFTRRKRLTSDTALLQYTSGSTREPHGVELSHANIIANAEAIAQAYVQPDEVCVSWLPLYHDMGLIGTMLTALYCRNVAIFMPPAAFIKEPSRWLRAISDYRATTTAAPNFAFMQCVRNVNVQELADVRLDSLRTALNGAEPVDVAAVQAFQEKFKVLGLAEGVVRPVYGLAESTLAVTFADPGALIVDCVDADRLERDGVAVSPIGRRRMLASVGRPVPTQRLRIAGSDDEPRPERQVGRILVNGPSVMTGYFNRPVETAAVLRDGWLDTGDLGYLSDGRLFVTGRSKDLIVRHGRNYYPQDIEQHVAEVGGIVTGRVAAFTVDADEDTRVVVVVEARRADAGVRAHTTRRIRERCQQVFLFGPDEVVFVPTGTIPRTTSGKVRRNECRTLYLASKLNQFDADGSVREAVEHGAITY